MFKNMRVLFLILLLPIAFACSENKGVNGSGGVVETPIIPPVTDNGGGNNNNNSGNIDDAVNEGEDIKDIPPVLGNAPDDQTPDASFNNDLSNPLHMVGRYKIVGVKINKGEETLLTEMDTAKFKGAFAVQPEISDTISIDLGVKFQFRPDVAKELKLSEALAYVNKKFNKPIDLSGGMDFGKIFGNLGATIDGNTVYFKLNHNDMPVPEGYFVVLILNKVSDKADFKLVNDPRKYWVEEGEVLPEPPVEPEEPVVPEEPVTPSEPEIPEDTVITPVDMADFKTLTGHYEITRFITVAAGVTVDSKDLPRMKGEVAVTGGADVVNAISKMQMEADVIGMTPNDKYNYTPYEQFKVIDGKLTSSTPDPYIYSKAVITKRSDFEIEINQELKKNAPFVGLTDVNVTVIATKRSDKPKDIGDCGYWTTDTVQQCKEDGTSSMQNIDMTKPETLIGSYKLMNYGMEYQRPRGGQYERIWAVVRVLDGVVYEGKLLVKQWQGDVSLKANPSDAAKPMMDFKTQVEVPYQVQDAFLFGDFKDTRWRFFREIDNTNYKVKATANKNELMITVTRTFYYKYWFNEYPVSVNVVFIAQKKSDTPQEVTEDKYWKNNDTTPSMSVPDINNPRTITGHYKFTDFGYEYHRPNSTGSTWESNWASNPTAIAKMQGEMWINATDEKGDLIGGDLKKATVNVKYQQKPGFYTQDNFDDGMLQRWWYDEKFKFYHEKFNDSYFIKMDPKLVSNIKVCVKRNFTYNFWEVYFLVWKNKWKHTNVDVNLCFIGEKISDNPQEISGDKYW